MQPKPKKIMRVKTQTLAIAVCIAIVSIQFVSCKKSDVASNHLSQSTVEDVITDSVTDSSVNRGLVGWYTFNGDLLDHSGNSNNIVFCSATPTLGKAGAKKTAYKFDGINGYMQVNDSKSLNPEEISLYALIKPLGFYQGVCHSNRILCKGYDDNDWGRYLLGYDDQPYYGYLGCDQPVMEQYETFYSGYGDGSYASGALDRTQYVQKGEWYSIVYTYNGVNSKLYINGVLVNKVTKQTTFNRNTNPVFFGRNQDPNYPYYFKGIIDEIRIYRRAINAKEVAFLYNNN